MTVRTKGVTRGLRVGRLYFKAQSTGEARNWGGRLRVSAIDFRCARYERQRFGTIYNIWKHYCVCRFCASKLEESDGQGHAFAYRRSYCRPTVEEREKPVYS